MPINDYAPLSGRMLKEDDTTVNIAEVISGNALSIRSSGSNPSASQTRPNDTTAYSIGDVVGTSPATNFEFTNAGVSGGHLIILGAILEVRVNAIPSGMSTFRLHLYDSAPTAIADNSAFNLPSADRDKYLGYITLDTPVDLGDTLWSENVNLNKKIKLATGSTSIFGILETQGAYTPTANAVKKVTLEIVGV